MIFKFETELSRNIYDVYAVTLIFDEEPLSVSAWIDGKLVNIIYFPSKEDYTGFITGISNGELIRIAKKMTHEYMEITKIREYPIKEYIPARMFSAITAYNKNITTMESFVNLLKEKESPEEFLLSLPNVGTSTVEKTMNAVLRFKTEKICENKYIYGG